MASFATLLSFCNQTHDELKICICVIYVSYPHLPHRLMQYLSILVTMIKLKIKQ